MDSLGKMVRKPDYNQYTDNEVHAELCYAEVLLLKAVLTLCEDETLVSFVKAGLKVRSCYQSYRYGQLSMSNCFHFERSKTYRSFQRMLGNIAREGMGK